MADPVALNLANSWIRRLVAERRARARLDAFSTAEVAPESGDALAVREAVGALPRRQREAVVLRYWAGCSAADAGTAMGIEPATVRALTHQAVVALRTTFNLDLEESHHGR